MERLIINNYGLKKDGPTKGAIVYVELWSRKKILKKMRGLDQYYYITGWKKVGEPMPSKNGIFSKYKVELYYEK